MAFRAGIWSLVALIARVGVGGIFIAHGYDKLQDLGAVEGFFGSLGVPRPEIAATAVAYVEVVGGGLMVIGLLLPIAGTLLAGVVVGAWWFVQRPEAVLVSPVDTYELQLGLAVAALMIAFSGGGKVSADHLIASVARRVRDARADSRSYQADYQSYAPTPGYPAAEQPTGQYYLVDEPTSATQAGRATDYLPDPSLYRRGRADR
jgi:putative oxidoreductase